MCLIIDANVATHTFSSPPHSDFEPIRNALFQGQAYMVHGGRLTEEYSRIGKVVAALAVLDRAGRAKVIRSATLSVTEEKLRASGQCASNDFHIIALAQLSGARLLCSHDQLLHHDFTNKNLLSNPRGSIYQTPTHAHLIRRHCNK